MARCSLFAALSAALLCVPSSLPAGPASDALADCLVRNTTATERVMMIRWVTFAFASHPDLGAGVTVDPVAVAATDRSMADLFTALLADRCLEEARSAMAADGQVALEQSFMVLGQVASEELALAPEVSAAMAGFLTHIDFARLDVLFR